ncbi:hypothetical protein ACFYUK_25020 [Nonomuraea wenchangensis]
MLHRNRRSRLSILAIVAAACTFASIAAPVPAIGAIQQDTPAPSETPPKPVSEPPPGPPSYVTPEMQRNLTQRSLAMAADELRDQIDVTEKGGFAGIQLGDGEVILWWKGAPTRQVREAVRQVRPRAKVRIAQAAFSAGELEKASARLWAASGVPNGGKVHAVKMPFDGSGLQAAVEPQTTERALKSLPDVGVPVQVVEREPLETTSRCDDTAAWWGGAAIRNTKFGGSSCGNTGRAYNCTAGFGVRQGSNTYLLTAGHCGAPGDSFEDPFGQHIGVVPAGGERAAHDLLLIGTTAGGRIWDGTPGVNDFSKPVIGWGWTYGGQWLCMSGATSGAVCEYRVDGKLTSVCGRDIYGSSECWSDLISAQSSREDGALPGDSGGPVFELDASDWSRVRAMGTVTGHYWELWNDWLVFQDFGTAQLDFPGLTVITG